jgi:hypothetical protein
MNYCVILQLADKFKFMLINSIEYQLFNARSNNDLLLRQLLDSMEIFINHTSFCNLLTRKHRFNDNLKNMILFTN